MGGLQQTEYEDAKADTEQKDVTSFGEQGYAGMVAWRGGGRGVDRRS